MSKNIKDSVIREFSLLPSEIWSGVQRMKLRFKWKVDPFLDGSSIRKITIKRKTGEGPFINYTSNQLIGEYTLRTSEAFFAGKTIYELTVATEKGLACKCGVTFISNPISSLRDEISFESLSTIPSEISEKQPFTFILRLFSRTETSVPWIRFSLSEVDLGKIQRVVSTTPPYIKSQPLLMDYIHKDRLVHITDRIEQPLNPGEIQNHIIYPGMNEYRLDCKSAQISPVVFTVTPLYCQIPIIRIQAQFERDMQGFKIKIFEFRYLEGCTEVYECMEDGSKVLRNSYKYN